MLKEGLGEDFANRERIAKLLRFASTSSDAPTVGFADYKARMKEAKKPSTTSPPTPGAAKTARSWKCSEKGIEVLLMTDRVDEWALNYLHDFDGTPLQSVAKGAVGWASCKTKPKKSLKKPPKPSSPAG